DQKAVEANPTTWQAGNGSALSLTVPAGGQYELEVKAVGADGAASHRVAVPAGLSVDAGTFLLGDSGPFTGSVIATRERVVPTTAATNQAAEFRADYTYGGPSAVKATALISMSPSTSAYCCSITLNGTSAQQSVDNGAVRVPLGTLQPGTRGVLHINAPVKTFAAPGPLTAVVRIQYGDKTATLGSATTQITGVSLTGPSVTTTLSPVVSGYGPVAGEVKILDEHGDQVGSAEAPASGLWRATLTLPNRGNLTTYTLHAESNASGVTSSSSVIYVKYDTAHQEPSSVSLSQPDSELAEFARAQCPRCPNILAMESATRTLSVNLPKGVAHFPFTIVPGEPITVNVTFPHPDRIEGLTVRIGDVQAKAHNGVAVLDVPLDDLGPIYLDYTDVPPYRNPADLLPPAGELPPAGDPHALLDRPFSDYTNSKVTDDGNGKHTTTYDLPHYGAHVTVATSVGQQTSYTLTEGDVAFAKKLGVPLYSLHTDVHVDKDNPSLLNFSYTAYVAKDWLDKAQALTSQAVSPRVAATRLRALDAIPDEELPPVGTTQIMTPISVVGKIAGAVAVGNFAAHIGDVHDQLGQLSDSLGHLPSDARQHYQSELDSDETA
ncbi:MAG: hypothetical protein ACRDPB_04610, partial [Nocardioidaceae bacterium]